MTHSRRILLTMTIGISICILDTTVMSIALPAMQSGLHTDLAHLSWALNIYTILFACLTIPLGRIADIYGRERLYLVGLSLFFLGSIASGLAPTVGFLIAGRALQSVGAAIVFPASMTIGIQSTSLASRTQAIALLGVTQGLAAAFGPTIGGVLTQYFGWRTIFLINLPLALAALGLCLHLLDWHHTGGQHETLDIPGALTSMLALFSLSLLLIKGNGWGWTSWRIIGLIGTCGLALALFLVIESHVAQPMMPLALFKDQQFNGAAIVTVAAGIFFVALMVILPSFFTKIQGATELQAALMITPASLMLFICSPISGFLLSKVGPRAVIATGCLAILSGYITLSLSNPAVYWQVSIALMLSGAGYAVIIGPVTVLAAGDFSGKLLTASQSVIGVFRQIGTSLAVAIFVSALSANISTAKITVSHHAEQAVAALTIPAKAKRDTLKTVNHQLATERVSAPSPTTFISTHATQQLIQGHYQAALQQAHALQAPAPIKHQIHAQVSRRVSQQVRQANRALTHTVRGIHRDAKRQLTRAFIRPYQLAIPFAGLMLSVLFLFKSRRRYHRQLATRTEWGLMNPLQKNTWETIQQTTVTDLRVARQHLWLNVGTYLGLFVIELSCAQLAHSQVLRADAFNNLSGIFSTSLLMTGLYMAAKTHDNDLWGAPIAPSEQLAMSPRIQQSRFRFETLYTLVAGLVMVEIAGNIIYQATRALFSPTTPVLQSRIAGIGAGLSTFILLLLWLANWHWAHRLANTALVAAAQDSWTDALTSGVTVLTVVSVTTLHLPWLDSNMSMLLGGYILYTGIQIFRKNGLDLVDYFDPTLEQRYRQVIDHLPAVKAVVFLKAYHDGNLIMVSVTVAVKPTMTAAEIFQLTQQVDTLMKQTFNVAATALMVIPSDQLPWGATSRASQLIGNIFVILQCPKSRGFHALSLHFFRIKCLHSTE